MVEFLEELKSSKVMDGVNKIYFLFTLDVVCGLNIFKLFVCFVGQVEGQEGTAGLEVCVHGDLQVLIPQVMTEGQGVFQGELVP